MKLVIFLLLTFSSLFVSQANAASDENSIGPKFETLLPVVGLDVDCYGKERCVVPMSSVLKLEEETEAAHWEISNGEDVVKGYRVAIARYLIEQKYATRLIEDFTEQERLHAAVGINTLTDTGYWTCLGKQIRSAPEEHLESKMGYSDVVEVALSECHAPRVRAMKRLGKFFNNEFLEFARYDAVRDGRLPGAYTAEILNNVQNFALAYNTALRGKYYLNHIEFITLPKPELDEQTPKYVADEPASSRN